MASKDVSPKEKANLKTLSKYVRLNLGTAAHSRPIEIPNLTDLQKISYEKFLKEGLPKILSDISPITDYTGKNFRLEFFGLHMGQPKFGPEASVQKGLSFDAPLTVSAKLLDLELQSSQTQEVYLGDIPQMTDRGTFIINGVERTVVSQLSRSPGVYFEREQDPLMAKFLYTAEVRPERGVWLRFETGRDCSLWVRMQRAGRKICAATILRAFGLKQKEIEEAFGPDEDPSRPFLKNTLAHDASHTPEEAFLEIYGKLRPGDPRILENAKAHFGLLFLEKRYYSLGKVGRYKINRRLGLSMPEEEDFLLLQKEDLAVTLKELIRLNLQQAEADEIDHLSNRRLRGVGELVGQSFRIGLLRLERLIKERLSLSGLDQKITPLSLVNARPVVAALNEFFGSSQLAQLIDQENPLSEVSHLRRVSALGPGGLSRERAGVAVRDAQASHYGRLDVIETPEGQNIGLNLNLAVFARLNSYGFLESPTYKVEHRKEGHFVHSREILYLDALDEEKYRIAEAIVATDEKGKILDNRVPVRFKGDFSNVPIAEVDLIDASSFQMLGVSSGLIPFVSSDVGNRALMGANMQRQAVPLINPQSPMVGTGLEKKIAQDSGRLLTAKKAGRVVFVDSARIEIETGQGIDRYNLIKFLRSNKDTCFNQTARVRWGQEVRLGEPLTDGPSTENGEIALGRDLLTAFMPWEGYNYEDSIVVSERVVKDDLLTSIHIKEYEAAVMDTKLGQEEVTRDIPNVSEEALRNLDASGIVVTGAEVKNGDILVGKIAPKGETELTAEERLLRAIFGEKAREVRDTSLYLPHGDRGTVLSVETLEKAKGDALGPGVLEMIKVKVAQIRKIQVGDKVAGRHGSKGVVAKIVRDEDMPYLSSGEPIDILLNPISILARMNIGQILETHLGWAGNVLGEKYAVPGYDKVALNLIQEKLAKAGLPKDGKITLFDGRTSLPFPNTITVGYAHIMKLNHLVEDKVHARSTGPYSLITQQPLGGKAQMGGQRLGEMEVWALEAYGAANVLQEMLTIKSDDVVGRSKAFEAIIKGLPIPLARVPETFKLLMKELNALSLSIETIKTE